MSLTSPIFHHSFTLSPQRQDTSAIEKTLLEWVNKERSERELGPLKWLPGLSAIAKGHSRDMASRQKLTHLSSAGKSYAGRLLDGGAFFVEIGENGARSDSFDAAFIHQSLMDSPEHRENILNPNFDMIGIAVVYANDKKYYITQDFLQTLPVLDEDEAVKFVQNELNKIRKENALPPLNFQKVASNFAKRQAEKKAAGKPPLNIANFFGETHIHFITSPELVIPRNVSQKIANAIYETAGIGVWFGRLPDYPGGTYLITLFLFPISRYKDLTEKDFVKITLSAMNAKRQEKGLIPIKLDRRNSSQAAGISRQLKSQRPPAYVLPAGPIQRQVLSYVTENPRTWPANLDPVITDPGLRRIGIGISWEENKDTRSRTYLIPLIF